MVAETKWKTKNLSQIYLRFSQQHTETDKQRTLYEQDKTIKETITFPSLLIVNLNNSI